MVLLEQLKNNYTLCKYCLKRHVPSVRSLLKMDQENCFICRGLMNKIDLINKKIISAVNNVYEFDSFLIGATIPNEYYEREDQIRSKFKIRGKENVKVQLTKELRRRFLNVTVVKEKVVWFVIIRGSLATIVLRELLQRG